MQAIKHVVISCAGLGSRLGMNIPKCLLPIHNQRMIDYILDLLVEIPNVFIVVGFEANQVMDYIVKKRPDAIFVYNHLFANSTNAYSLYLATRHLNDPFLSIDGDLLIDKKSFQNFIDKIKPERSLLGITKAKSQDAVYAITSEQQVIGFSREKNSEWGWEWSGVAYFSNIKIPIDGKFIFEELTQYLPLDAFPIECYEVDTPQDLEQALHYYKEFQFTS